jgi:glycosyltransferase involved in cell wall biosynthesis
MKASVILATYNQPRKLAAALYSLTLQSEKNFEIVVADDGSRDDTRALVDAFRKSSGLSVRHQWQEDDGFRKARILNASVRASTSDKLIFMDGDTFAHKDFVSDHVAALERSDVFLGRRVMLGPEPTEMVEANPKSLGSFKFWLKAFVSTFAKLNPTRHLNRGLRLPLWLITLLKYDRVPDLIGCNFSVRREAFVKVNGFDEKHVGYGNEDGDLYIRLRNSDARIEGAKCYAVQWHLWHQERAFKPGAEDFYNDRLKNDHTSVWCEHGLVTAKTREDL